RKLLRRARKANYHVADFLRGRDLPEGAGPGHWSPGDANEASMILDNIGQAWASTPGATDLLK
ncbi:MAG: hypothetical protein KDB53_09405, partial [Planctomycetes bacterium]|nr:hypothetical protein [Planctomycetota bacterium]